MTYTIEKWFADEHDISGDEGDENKLRKDVTFEADPIHETAKAELLLLDDNRQIWVPKSVIKDVQ